MQSTKKVLFASRRGENTTPQPGTDQTPPVISNVPDTVTVATVDDTGKPNTDTAIHNFLSGVTANDNVDGAVLGTNNALATFPLGQTTVRFSATDALATFPLESTLVRFTAPDAAGNTGTATAAVTGHLLSVRVLGLVKETDPTPTTRVLLNHPEVGAFIRVELRLKVVFEGA